MARPLPADPIVRRLVQQAQRAQLSRRALLAGGTAGAATLALAACAPGGQSRPTAAADVSDTDKTVRWSNWPYYLDNDNEDSVDDPDAHPELLNYPTLNAFIEATGIDAAYNVEIDDNNTYFAKVRDQLLLGQDIGADAVCLTDWMVNRWIRQGFTQELDHANMPNVANLDPNLQDVTFDPGRKYSLPWQGGYAGLVWNKETVPNGIKSVEDLWKPEFKGRVVVLSELRDTMGVIMLSQGVDISADWSEDDFQKALDLFRDKVESGQIRNVQGNSYAQELQNGNVDVGIVWSGDVSTLNLEYDEPLFEFALPDSGGTLWYDNFMVPIGSPHKKNAEKLIDWYYQPEIAAEVAAYVSYITPVEGAEAAMADIAPELVGDWLIFPDASVLSRVKMFRALNPAEEQTFQNSFSSVLLGA